MSENGKPSHQTPSLGSSPGETTIIECLDEKQDDDFEKRLAGLPDQYRDEILRQYEIPETNASLFAVLRYATLFEKLLMIIGAFMAIASGTLYSHVTKKLLICVRRRPPPYDRHLWEFDQCFRRIR